MKITRLELKTQHLKEQALFYGEALGLDTRIIAGNEVVVRAGATQLVFTAANEGPHGPYHFAFNIPANQFETAQKWLAMRAEILVDKDGSTILHSKSWNSNSLYFKDFSGNILELIARYDLKNDGDQFEFLSVSEIGLATDNVPALVNSLNEKIGVLPYKNESSETFTAVGNADGLFIVVKQGRIWYPNTGVPAQLLPLRVQVQVDETSMILSGVPYQMELSTTA